MKENTNANDYDYTIKNNNDNKNNEPQNGSDNGNHMAMVMTMTMLIFSSHHVNVWLLSALCLHHNQCTWAMANQDHLSFWWPRSGLSAFTNPYHQSPLIVYHNHPISQGRKITSINEIDLHETLMWMGSVDLYHALGTISQQNSYEF